MNYMENHGKEFIEPAPKKFKMDESIEKVIAKKLIDTQGFVDKVIAEITQSKNNLSPIIDDTFTRKITNIPVHVATIKKFKDISTIILKLNSVLPVSELQHLKRIRKPDIIVGTVKNIGEDNIEKFVGEKCEDIRNLLENFKIVEVPERAPKVRWQFNESSKCWPINFHPNLYNESLVSGNFFNETDLKKHKLYMTVAFEVANIRAEENRLHLIEVENSSVSKDIAGTVIVDPKTDSIVAISYDNRHVNPLQHSAMVAIDNVSKSQNGGAWITGGGSVKDLCGENVVLNGIEGTYLTKLKARFPALKFGAMKFKPKSSGDKNVMDDLGPYLCTNYYVYTIHEPCVMCSMALVHARARRIFFACDNVTFGSLKSKCKLQTIKSLNHHFEVFTGFLI